MVKVKTLKSFFEIILRQDDLQVRILDFRTYYLWFCFWILNFVSSNLGT